MPREVRVRLLPVCLSAVASIGLSACGDDRPPTTPSVTPPAFHHVEMEGGGMSRDLGAPGDSMQLRVSAVFDDGSRSDVTNDAAWSVNNPGIATVSGRGLVTGVGPGTVTVTAIYRERSSIANLRVAYELGPQFAVTGVVRGEGGAPIAGAEVGAVGRGRIAYTDGSGHFDLGMASGSVTLLIGAFGYADATVSLPVLTAPVNVAARLDPNPGSYIERTLEGGFESTEGLTGIATLRISTRAGGIFDAEGDATSCDYNGNLGLTGESGGRTFTGRTNFCRARLRFVVPDGVIQLTIRGYKSGPYRLRYREPR